MRPTRPRRSGPRQRRSTFIPRQDRGKLIIGLEAASRPRLSDWGDIPVNRYISTGSQLQNHDGSTVVNATRMIWRGFKWTNKYNKQAKPDIQHLNCCYADPVHTDRAETPTGHCISVSLKDFQLLASYRPVMWNSQGVQQSVQQWIHDLAVKPTVVGRPEHLVFLAT